MRPAEGSTALQGLKFSVSCASRGIFETPRTFQVKDRAFANRLRDKSKTPTAAVQVIVIFYVDLKSVLPQYVYVVQGNDLVGGCQFEGIRPADKVSLKTVTETAELALLVLVSRFVSSVARFRSCTFRPRHADQR